MLDAFRHTARSPFQLLHVVCENDERDGAVSFESLEIYPALQAEDLFVYVWYQKLVRGSAMAGGIETALSGLASEGDDLPFCSRAAIGRSESVSLRQAAR